MFTYEDVWDMFLVRFKTEDINIPKGNDAVHALIQSACMDMDNRMKLNLNPNNETEVVEGLTTKDELIILAAYVKLTILENEKIYYTSIYQPMNSDVGVRNFNTSVSSMKEAIDKQERRIDTLIFNTMEDFI